MTAAPPSATAPIASGPLSAPKAARPSLALPSTPARSAPGGRSGASPPREPARARREHEVAVARARTAEAMHELALSIHTGDRRYTDLRLRLDDFGRRLDNVRADLRRAGYLMP